MHFSLEQAFTDAAGPEVIIVLGFFVLNDLFNCRVTSCTTAYGEVKITPATDECSTVGFSL
jgi:hypothetical protein